jgi:hypothetical protein
VNVGTWERVVVRDTGKAHRHHVVIYRISSLLHKHHPQFLIRGTEFSFSGSFCKPLLSSPKYRLCDIRSRFSSTSSTAYTLSTNTGPP